MNVLDKAADDGGKEYTKLSDKVEGAATEVPKPPEANEYSKLKDQAEAATPDVPEIEVPDVTELNELVDKIQDAIPMDLLNLGGHNGRLVTFLQPTYCALCGKFIWGFFLQGFRCKDCRMATHRLCYPLVFGKCTCKEQSGNEEENLNQPEEPEKDNSRAHDFEAHTFKTPTFCDHCGSLLYGCCSQGVKCKECKKNVHHKCKDKATHLCGVDVQAALKKIKEMQEKIPGFGASKSEDEDKDKKEDDTKENGEKPEEKEADKDGAEDKKEEDKKDGEKEGDKE